MRKITHPQYSLNVELHVQLRLVLHSNNTKEITIFSFSFYYFYCMHMDALSGHMSVHSVCAWSPWGPEEGIEFGTEIRGVCVCWELSRILFKNH